MGFASPVYSIDMEWMREAYRRTRKDGAVAVDGQAAAEYAMNLDVNLLSLLDGVLTQKLPGRCAYFGITGNALALCSFYRRVRRIGKKPLGRRSQRGHIPWPHETRCDRTMMSRPGVSWIVASSVV